MIKLFSNGYLKKGKQMSVRLKHVLWVTVLAVGLIQGSYAETPQERAAKIKEWRANCDDPDSDLRIAYLEAAIAGKDQTIIRTCIKQTITSDNADVRNLALRAALASSERLTIEFSMPEAYEKDKEAAGDDSKRMRQLKKDYNGSLKALELTNGILSITPKSVEMDKQKSSWFILGANTNEEDQLVANLSVVGDQVTGNGQANIGYLVKLSLNLTLNDAGELVGEGKLYHSDSLPMKIKLL